MLSSYCFYDQRCAEALKKALEVFVKKRQGLTNMANPSKSKLRLMKFP